MTYGSVCSGRAYYNEHNAYAAEWLRNLMAEGLIAPGVVDERSIEDVAPDELAGYTQCHFFAGIGVWSYALRRAGWRDEWPVWTGSCPCQPFSAAGKGAGLTDERHLWPAFFHLIRVRRPGTIFSEQVASKDGRGWLDIVRPDLESEAYAVAPASLCAAGVGAHHIRQRLYFVANAKGVGGRAGLRHIHERELGAGISSDGCSIGGLGNTPRERRGEARASGGRPAQWFGDGGAGGDVVDSRGVGDSGAAAGSGDRNGEGMEGVRGGVDWVLCRDPRGPRWRPVSSGTFPLAHGAPTRVGPDGSTQAQSRQGMLSGYGNAIHAGLAQAFIECAMEAVGIAGVEEMERSEVLDGKGEVR